MTPTDVTMSKPGLDFARIRNSLLQRFNPIRYATADRLGQELDALYTGRLTIGRFWEAMKNRDDMIRACDGKRKDAVENMEWCVNVDSERAEEFPETLVERQKEVLKAFYAGLNVTDALRQDQVGGVGLLARQMLDARACGWAVHEITWRPMASDGLLTASLRFCPVYWFENTEGRLRFLLQDWDYYGVEMAAREWLVSVSDNYMEALTGPWLYKLQLVRAWVRFCERFGHPLPIGKTDSPKDSPEWDNLVEAVAAINEDFGLVVNSAASLEFPNLERSGDGTFQALYEDMKRMIAVVILGSDLSTLSAGSGQGQGASLQGREDEKREKADASFISETLNRTLDRWVIEYYFGKDAPLLAKFTLHPPKRIDVLAELKVDETAANLGVPIGVDDFRERFGRSEPADGAEVLRSPMANPNPASGDNPQGSGNGASSPPVAGDPELSNASRLATVAAKQVAQARAYDLESIGRELAIITAMKDPKEMMSALNAWLLNNDERARKFIERSGELDAIYEKLLATGVVNGFLESKSVKK